MEIRVKRGQEFKKGRFLSGKNVRLTLEVAVASSEEDNRLIEKYYDPSISSFLEIRRYYDGTEEAYKQVKVDREESSLSKFHLIAHVDDGHRYLGNIQGFEKAMVRALNDKLSYLKALESWEGEMTLTTEEEPEGERSFPAEDEVAGS
jgi:hypothetical protein